MNAKTLAERGIRFAEGVNFEPPSRAIGFVVLKEHSGRDKHGREIRVIDEFEWTEVAVDPGVNRP